MKMAAAEALYESSSGNAPFSIFTVGSLDGQEKLFSIEVPGVLSYMATGSTSGAVKGIDELDAAAKAQYGAGELTASPSYVPTIWLTYWNFRLMMGAGFLTMVFAVWALWKTRRGGVVTAGYWKHIGIWTPLLPVLAMSFGWIFTEAGRQPWIVNGMMSTSRGVSPIGAASVWVTLILFTLVYGALAVVEVKLLLRYIQHGAVPVEEPVDPSERDADAPFVFAY